MQRREFIAALSGAALWPISARAQQQSMPVIGLLHEGATLGPAFHAGLKEVGLVEGQNVRIEYRWAESRYDRLPALAAELVALKPDVLVGTGSAAATALKKATDSIPTVFLSVGDPVGIGLIESLSRPGGNITGLAVYVPGNFLAKTIDTLREVVPHASKIAVLINPGNQIHRLIVADELPRVAQNMRLDLPVVEARTPDDIEPAFSAIAAQKPDAILVFADTMLNRPRVAELTIEHRLPGLSLFRLFPNNGGLMSYGPDVNDLFRRGGYFIDKILKGIRPADLPVQQPTKFELVINLKAAKALDIVVPSAFLARADAVIE
ncbi:MAG: ABC transporter substrate-binding protein [Bradyrhizobium sp.]|nr:ABC transporter substrate-binding protein [Bradyrhizobium sp.]